MSRFAPVLTEVVVRAWGTDDPRVLTHLRAENQPGRWQRATALKERAKDAGWPPLNLLERNKAATAAVRRLEGVDFKWNGTNHHDLFLLAAHESRRGDVAVTHDDGVPDLVTIFDE